MRFFFSAKFTLCCKTYSLLTKITANKLNLSKKLVMIVPDECWKTPLNFVWFSQVENAWRDFLHPAVSVTLYSILHFPKDGGMWATCWMTKSGEKREIQTFLCMTHYKLAQFWNFWNCFIQQNYASSINDRVLLNNWMRINIEWKTIMNN